MCRDTNEKGDIEKNYLIPRIHVIIKPETVLEFPLPRISDSN